MKDEMIKLLLNHRSVREFENLPISEQTKFEIVRCAQTAPTSSHFQAYSIIEITSPEKRAALYQSSGGQDWLNKAPLALLFCADLHRFRELASIDDMEVFSNTEAYTVAVTDAALAAQKALIAAQANGIYGVPVGGVRNNIPLMKELFELPDFVMPLFVLCLGYPKLPMPDIKPRLPMAAVLHKDKYDDESWRSCIDDYNKEVLQYFSKLTDSHHDWVDRCNHAITAKPRYAVTDFAHSVGLLKK